MTKLLSWFPTGVELTEAEFRRRHRLIVAILWAHVPFLVVMAVIIGRPVDQGLLTAAPIAALALVASAAANRAVAASSASLGLLAGSAGLIHLSGGAIEAHFHIFVILVFVALYQDWRALGLTIAFTVVHHVGVSVLDPHGAFAHHAAQERPVLWAGIHAAFVVAEVVGILLFWRVTEDAQGEVSRAAAELAERDRAAADAERAALAARADEAARVQEALARREEATAHARRAAGSLQETMEGVERGVRTMADGIAQVSGSIDAITVAVSQASSVTAEAVERARTADRTVSKLAASSAEVGGVLELISRIAAQTNLLALNATIEAARAGEAGKGFAVVATEVKELARQTADAAVTISQTVETIRADAADTAGDLDAVVGTISEVDRLQDQVSAAVADQTAAAGAVTDESTRVAGDTGTAAGLAVELLDAVLREP